MKTFLKFALGILIIPFLVTCQDEESVNDMKFDDSIENLLDAGKIVMKNESMLKKLSKEDIESFLNNQLKQDGYNQKISKLLIQNSIKDNNEYQNLVLVGESNDKIVKIGVELNLLEDGSYEIQSKKTITCAGCRQGCDPITSSEIWYCTACFGTEGECKKTVVVTEEDPDPSTSKN